MIENNDDFINPKVMRKKALINLHKAKANDFSKKNHKFVKIDERTKVFRKA